MQKLAFLADAEDFWQPYECFRVSDASSSKLQVPFAKPECDAVVYVDYRGVETWSGVEMICLDSVITHMRADELTQLGYSPQYKGGHIVVAVLQRRNLEILVYNVALQRKTVSP